MGGPRRVEELDPSNSNDGNKKKRKKKEVRLNGRGGGGKRSDRLIDAGRKRHCPRIKAWQTTLLIPASGRRGGGCVVADGKVSANRSSNSWVCYLQCLCPPNLREEGRPERRDETDTGVVGGRPGKGGVADRIVRQGRGMLRAVIVVQFIVFGLVRWRRGGRCGSYALKGQKVEFGPSC